MPRRKGGDTIERLLGDGLLDQVAPNEALARRLIAAARGHLVAGAAIREIDATGAYQLAYDASRKSGAALLAVQGLRATTRGGHVAVQDAVQAQFGKAFSTFSRMRRRRNAGEYPDLDTPTITTDDADEGLADAAAMVEAAAALLDGGRVRPYR